MSAPTVSSMEADAIMDRAMGHGCATSGGRGTKKIQLSPYQRKPNIVVRLNICRSLTAA